MGFRLGFLSGFGAGYYLGARAGRPRYEQINRAVGKVRRSPAVETAVDTAAEKARSVVGRDGGATDDWGGSGGGQAGAATDALPVPAPDVTPAVPAGSAVVDPGDYSSSR